MVTNWNCRLALACGVAGLLLLNALPAPSAPFDPDAFGTDTKLLRFEASLAARDVFSPVNLAGPPDKRTVRRGEVVEVTVKGTPHKGYHTYPVTRRGPTQPTVGLSTLTVEGGAYLVPVYPVVESKPTWDNPRGLGWQLEHDEPFTWTFGLLVKPDAPVGSTQDLKIRIKGQVCNDKKCVEVNEVVSLAIPIGPEEPLTDSGNLAANSQQPPPTVETPPGGSGGTPSPGKTFTPGQDNLENASQPANAGLLQAILIAIGGGFISLLTPCVFPMIPITVSYFLKQSESKHGSAVLMALVYSGTIVLILAAGGLALLEVLTQISTHYATNFALGGIFLFFGLSLLGWYDVTLPSWLQDATSSREGAGGLIGAFFMALTFSIVSFSCVGPIYGGFISVNAGGGSSGRLQLVLSVVAFAMAFASPFFLLALFPRLLRSMPRAGSWMNSVKVVMGFLELAAVVKFIRTGELLGTGAAEYLSYDLSLGIYVALSVACGLYLLGVYRLPHDHDAPASIGVPRLLFSLGFLSLALYITPGVFKTGDGQSMRPRGLVFGWIDSFLLPDPDAGHRGQAAPGEADQLVWNTKLAPALEQARKENKLIFLDFTGMSCTNCKLNERDAFPRPEIQGAFRKHVLLKLYTDQVPAGTEQEPSARESLALRNGRFKSNALPLYALLQPDGDDYHIVRVYPGGVIQTPGERQAFVDFLSP